MSEWKRAVIAAGKRMLAEGVTIGAWGNISVRDEAGRVCITPSGMAYGTLTEDDIVVLAPDGTRLEGERKPSIETGLHLAVYAARPDCRAIVHTHPVYSTAFSAMGEDIPLFLDEAAQQLGDTVRTAEYALPGTPELAENCVRALGPRSMACLLRSHGAVCLGETLDQAFLVSQVLESTARIYGLIRSMGGAFLPLSQEDIRAMQEFVKNEYGQR
ncbi:MAG: class II aldolase/adducin family protein [Oscillospiraceae bacterium]|nr:class II aldolase/adducin family protein [Oscillospiraceae bacterium]